MSDTYTLRACETCGAAVMSQGIHRFNPGGGSHICVAQSVYPSIASGDIEIEIREENIYHAGPVGFEAMWDKILVLEDRFRSGYECDKCEETGKVRCDNCNNGKSVVNEQITCKVCSGTTLMNCPECDGKGKLLEIPDVAQRRPTTGRIVSVGSDVSPQLKRGDSVMYPSFCGEVMDLKGSDDQGREISIVVRMLKDKEIIARVTGHMELRRVSKQQFNVGG